jgi:hypothetical protein
MNAPEYVTQSDEPLYPNILYNRPLTRNAGATLLIVGGHSGEFSLPTAIHQLATAAGIGQCKVILPDRLVSLLGGVPDTYFVPSSTSGSLGREALGRILELEEGADGTAIGASLSNNSNTTILVEKLISSLTRQIIVFDEGLTALGRNISVVTDNPNALLILTMAEVFKLAGHLAIPIHIRPGGGLINKLEIIQDLTAASKCTYAVFGTEIITASGADITVTPINYRLSLLPAAFYGVLSTFWLQNPTSRTHGLVTGAYVIGQAGIAIGPSARPAVGDMAKAIGNVLASHDA